MVSLIELYCDDAGRHEARAIARLLYVDDEWIAAHPEGGIGLVVVGSASDVEASIAAHGAFESQPLGENDEPTDDLTDAQRRRWRFECTCGLTVPARHDRLAPILDMLAVHGVARISLSGLAARLT